NAFDQLQRLLPQATQLAGQGLTGARGRAFDRYIQQIAEILAKSATAQATVADKQLELLGKNADALRTSAEGKTAAARAQLESLDSIASLAKLAAGAGLSLTDTAIIAMNATIYQFSQDAKAMLDYLGAEAGTKLHKDLDDIAKLLGADGDISSPVVQAMNRVIAALPSGRAGGGPVEAGETVIVGERRAEFFTPAERGTISNAP